MSARRFHNLQLAGAPSLGVVTERLLGHSGCELVILRLHDKLRVRKTSANEKYNERLRKQCEKQKQFIGTPGVFAPRVWNSGFHEGLFYFEMDYVHGQNFASFVESAPSILVLRAAKRLASLLMSTAAQRNLEENNAPTDAFAKKLTDLRGHIVPTPTIEAAFQLLMDYDWSAVPQNSGHGDLTFENIVVGGDGHLYLIDFLDSFHDSWLMDLAKLLQDLELGWSFRNSSQNTNRELRLKIFKDELFRLLALESNHALLPTLYRILLLNVLRILPYANASTMPFLENALKVGQTKLIETEMQIKRRL